MKKIIIPSLLLLAGATVGVGAVTPTLAEGEELSSEVVETSVMESSEEEISSELESGISSFDSSDVEASVESQLDSIYSEAESYITKIVNQYADSLKEKEIFGVSVGSLIGVAVAALGYLLSYLWNKKWKKQVAQNVIATGDSISSLKQVAENITQVRDEYEAKLAALVTEKSEEMKALSSENEATQAKFNELVAKVQELTTSMDDYQALVDKIDALLASMKLLSSNEEDIKNGVATQVEEIVKGVMGDGSESEETESKAD